MDHFVFYILDYVCIRAGGAFLLVCASWIWTSKKAGLRIFRDRLSERVVKCVLVALFVVLSGLLFLATYQMTVFGRYSSVKKEGDQAFTGGSGAVLEFEEADVAFAMATRDDGTQLKIGKK